MDTNILQEKIESIFEKSGYELVDIKIFYNSGKMVIQAFIEKECGNITLTECEEWSSKIGSYIDMNELIQGAYVLEVSSPGVNRIIKKEKDFKKFKGQEVKITLKNPLDGTRVYYSKIIDFENETAIFENDLKFNIKDIQEVRLNPNYEELLKKH